MESAARLQKFIGMIGFYHRFVPGLAETLAPLHALLNGNPKNITRPPDFVKLIDAAKSKLSEATLLNFPASSAPLALTTDASSVAVGAILEQYLEGQWKPIAFFSRKLSPAETRYMEHSIGNFWQFIWR